MKIMTFNINHFVDNYGSNKIEHQKFADYIKSVNPDVLGFNEVRAWDVRPAGQQQPTAQSVASTL